MGHDVNAFRTDPALLKYKKDKAESHLACLQRSPLDPHNKRIYLALYVKKFYGTESGKGDCKRFKSSQIKRAIREIRKLDGQPIEYTEAQKKSFQRMADIEKELGGRFEMPVPEELGYAEELEFLQKCNIGDSVWIEFG